MEKSKNSPTSRRWLILGGILLVLLIGGYYFLSQRTANRPSDFSPQSATVSSVTVAETVQASGSLDAVQSASLYWKTGGVVEFVNIKPGDQVKAGDVLMSLNPSSVSSSIVSAQADLATAKVDLQTLLDSKTTQANAQLAVVNAQQAVDDAQIVINGYARERSTQLSQDYYKSQVVVAEKSLDRAQKSYDGVSNLDSSDQRRAQATIALYNAKQNYNTALANYNWSIGKPTASNINLAEANLAIAQAQLEDAQRQWNILKDGPDPNAVAVAQAKVNAAQATVNMLSVIAPFDGEVVAVFNQSNDLVDTSTLAVIIANRKTYSITAQVDETDITKLKAGQAVEVKLDALPDLKLTGVVESVSLFGQSVSGVVKYDVFISVQGDKTDLPLGATANVTIQVSKPTTALAVPITAVYSDDQGDYVLLPSGGAPQRVSVQAGDIVGSLVAVTGELKEGDKVLLAQTATASTTSGTGTNQRGPGFFGP